MKWSKRKLNDESDDKIPSIILSTELILNLLIIELIILTETCSLWVILLNIL